MTDLATPREPRYAGFWIRVVATTVDLFVSGIVLTPLLLAMHAGDYLSMANKILAEADAPLTVEQLQRLLQKHAVGLGGPVDVLVQVVLPAIAVILFWRFKGATPGKMLIAAKIVDARTLGKPSTAQLIGRFLAYVISMLPAGIGLLWVAFDKRKQGWHDKLAGTVVIFDDGEQAE